MKNFSFIVSYVPTTGTTRGMNNQDIVNDFKKNFKEHGIDIIDVFVVEHDENWPLMKVTIPEDDEEVKEFFDFYYDEKDHGINTINDLKERIKERGF